MDYEEESSSREKIIELYKVSYANILCNLI